MTIQLTAEGVRAILPRAPQAVVDAFVAKQAVLDAAGITHTRLRLSVAFSQVEHETDGFTIKDLTENIRYSAEGAARVWPSRFKNAAAVRAKYGTAPGWQVKLIDDVYGGRMGNRRGTHDGSTFIGRAGPQITGLEGYREVGKRAGLPLAEQPTLACKFDLQPEILAAFWTWKNLNPVVDAGGLKAATKPWNGGYIGMADREARMKGNDPIIARLQNAERVLPIAKDLPGGPPTKEPPKDAIDAATKKERAARAAGAASGAGGGVNEGAKVAAPPAPKGNAATEQPTDLPLLPTPIAYGLVAVGIVVVVVASILIVRKRAAIVANWF